MEWQTIKTAPRDGTLVDLWHKEQFRMSDAWWVPEDQCWTTGNNDSDFTHWMPVPEAPKQIK